MANPIPFSVNAAIRGAPAPTGESFTSPTIIQAGFTKIYWELAIPTKADFENPANSVTYQLLVNGDGPTATWVGGPSTNKAGAVDPPPAVEWDISQVPDGAILQAKVTVFGPSRWRVGIQNGLVS